MNQRKQLYNEFADIPSLEEQKAKILSIFDEVKAAIIALADIGVKLDNSKSVRQVNTAEKEYNATVKQTENLIKQLADTEAKLLLVRQKETLFLNESKLKLKELNKEQVERLRLQKAEEGSIEKLELQYAKAYRIFKQLGEEQRNTTRGQTLNKYLEDTSNKLNELKKSAGNFSANVGRYAGSLAAPFELLINKVEELKANLAKGIGIGGGTDAASLAQAQQAINTITTTIQKGGASTATSVTQVKALSNAFQDLSITLGKSGGTTETSFLNKLKAQVGAAKDDVADLKDELKLQASDTRGIDNVVGSLNALAGIAQGAAGAYALLGASQEDAAKITSKLIAVQGIANSVQMVGQELTRKGTTANKIYEFSLNTMSTAFGASSTAAARFNAILKVGVVGLVITGIVLLINKLIELKAAQDAAGRSAKDLQEIRAEGLKNSTEELTKIRLIYEASQNQTLSYKQRKKAVDELQEQYPQYFKNLTDEEILTGKASKAYEELTKNILRTGLAQAAKDRITEISSQMLDDVLKVEEANKRIESAQKNGVFVQSKIQPKTLASGNTVNIAPGQISLDEKDIDQTVSKIKSLYAKSFAAVDDGNARIKAIIEGVGAGNLIDGIIGDPKELDKAKKIADNTAATILKEQFEQNKLILEAAKAKDKRILDDETETYEERLSALRNFTSNQMALIELEQQFQVAQEKMRLQSVKDSLEEQKKEKGANIKAINDQIRKEQAASDEVLKTITLKAANDLLNIGLEFNKGLKDLADKRQDIRDEERRQIEEYNEWILREEKRLRKLLSDLNEKSDKEEADKKEKAITDVKARIKQQYETLYKEVVDTISFFLTSSIDKETAALETRKRLLDEETQRRINQINLLGLTESERIKRTAQIEKQAAYEKEQIEKRQRKLAVERAKFEKAANIASIIGNTAAAVIKALKDAPYPYNILLAALIGATGALQLARAAAAPLPQYYTGTDSAKPGDAWVSEKGSELMQRDGRWYLTPKKPTIMKMKGGEKIINADLTRDIMASLNYSNPVNSGGVTLVQVPGMSSDQADTLINEIKDLKKETAKNKVVLNIGPGIDWDAYINKNIR